MSIVGKVSKYEAATLYLENRGEPFRKIKLSPDQEAGIKSIGLPPGKEPGDLVGEHVRAFVRKRKFNFAAADEWRCGFVYNLAKIQIL